MNGPPGANERRPHGETGAQKSTATTTITKVTRHLDIERHSVPTLLDVCDWVESETTRILSMADVIDVTAAFIENTWCAELREAVRRARDFATIERLWAA